MSLNLFFIYFVLFSLSKQEIKPENLTKIKDFPNENNKSNIILEKIKSKIRKLVQENEEEPILGNSISLVIEFVSFVQKYLKDHPYADLNNEIIEECLYEGIVENLNDEDLLNTCIRGSGKSLNDFGNEFECDSIFQPSAEYFTLHFYLEEATTLTSEEDAFFFDFLKQRYFYIGLCIPKKCNRAVRFLLNNTKTLGMLYKYPHLRDFKLFYKDENLKRDLIDELCYNFFWWMLIIILFFCFGKLFIGICRIIAFNKGYQSLAKKELDLDSFIKERKESNDEKDNKKGEDDMKINDSKNDDRKESLSLLNMKYNDQNNELSEIYNRDINGSFNDNIDLFNPFNDYIKKLPLHYRVMKAFDLFDNISTLTQLSNKYYNSNNIKRFYLIRFVLMIMNIVYQLVYSQMELPYKDFINKDFYNSFAFVFIKFCMNASTFWITLDAVIIGYKLMSFMKKEIILSKNSKLKFYNLSKILLLVIPKFIVFIICFLCLHLFATDLTFTIIENNNVFSSFLYYKDLIQARSYTSREFNESKNFKTFLKFFIPFHLNYLDFFKNTDINDTNYINYNNYTNCTNCTNYTNEYSDYEMPSPFLTNTNLFVNVYFNEFYLLIIMILISYISYILRNKIFDFAILFINIILFILPIFDLNSSIDDIIKKDHGNVLYSLKYVLGQNYTEKYTHYFINFFYFGFLIGVMKFYHDEEKLYSNKNKNKIFPMHLPFEFCKIIIIFINKLKFIYKRIIFILSFFIIFLLSGISYFEMNKNADYGENIKNPFYLIENYNDKKPFYYFFLYEKNLNGIFFFIILIMYIVYPKSKNIMKLAETQGFILIERISFSFFCSFVYIIYAQFSIFIINIQISHLDIYLNTLGIFSIICTASILITTTFELPLRQLIKFIMNRNIENRIKNSYSKNDDPFKES